MSRNKNSENLFDSKKSSKINSQFESFNRMDN